MDRDRPRSAPEGNGEPTSQDRASVRSELNRLRALAQGLSWDDLRRGSWFAQLLRLSLDGYVHQVDAAFFATAYPGLDPDEVAAARIQQAARLASIEGGLSAGAYTGAVAATIGSGGAASPLGLPAAGASFVLDLLFMSNLQLRLAYDLSVIYGVPLDLDDPEDLWKLIRTAFAVKGAEAGRGAIGKSVPLVLRPVLSRIVRAGTVSTATTLPTVGRYLLRRNLVSFAVPAVGVPLSMAVNYWSIQLAADHAVPVLRREGRVVEAAGRLTRSTPHHAELLWVLWLVVKSDALIHENERLLLKHVARLVADLDSELIGLGALTSTLVLDAQAVWAMLGTVGGDLAPLYEAGVVAAAVDGKINANELRHLRRLADCCSVPFDEQAIREAARQF